MDSSNFLLIVDDEPELLEILELLCQDITKNIKLASNGQEALEIFHEFQIDTILSDINMPYMTGLDLLSRVRAEGSKVPFIIVTGYRDNANSTEALRLGATHILDKPYDEEALLALVRSSLKAGSEIRRSQIK